MNGIAKTIIIPPGCVENFVDFSDLPEGENWFGGGVVMAALARHVPGYFVDYPAPRRHDVQYCIRGGYRYEYDGKYGELQPGELLVLPGGRRQKFHALERSESVFFLLDPAIWCEVGFLHTRSIYGDLLLQLLKTALHERYSPMAEGVFRRELAHMALSLVRREIAGAERRESPLELLADKLRLRPELPWTVAEMAALCGVSSSHLHALCRKRGIPSPYVLLTRIRMELAEMLLTRTDYPVKVIASQCGYALPFSFTRAFSKHAGMSPQQFRRISIAARGGGHFTKRMRSR